MAKQGRNPRERKPWNPGQGAPTAERQRGVSCDGDWWVALVLSPLNQDGAQTQGWKDGGPNSHVQTMRWMCIVEDDRKAFDRPVGPLGGQLMHRKLNK